MTIIGIDTGGTFTDVAAYEPESGTITVTKVPSNPARPDEAILQALDTLDLPADLVERLVHGTTVATNALLERRGARLALITNEGFRDTLEIGRTRRAEPGLFNTKATRPQPLVPRTSRFEVSERTLADGSLLQPLDEASVEGVLDAVEAQSPDAVVVCLLHSYVNASHERRLGEMIGARFPEIPVQLSSDLLSEYREYERLSTAVINAYILPFMADYLNRLSAKLELQRRRLFVMSSNGGSMTARTAASEPARTFLSGPAGGVQGAILVGRTVGIENLITCDMGGTSTDVSFVRDSEVEVTNETMVAGLPLKLPQLEISTVGAGGGSIAWIDVDGALCVGPQSAGAVPGPVCYDQGGQVPTVTDASLHLGRLGADSLLAGELQMSRSLATTALDQLCREAAVDDVDLLAEGIIRLAVAKMVGAIREISVERGYDPGRAVLVPMGGAGPMYAADIAGEMGIPRILVPPHPGNMSAIGLLAADIRHNLTRTWMADLEGLDIGPLRADLEALREEGRTLLRDDGFEENQTVFEPAVDMRYRGQAFELMVPLADDIHHEAMGRDFEQLYETRYGFRPEGRGIEIVAIRMVARGKVPALRLKRIGAHAGGLETARKGERPVYFNGRWHKGCPVYDRARLGAGAVLAGLAIVEEYGSTTVLPPGWRAEVDDWGHLVISDRSGEVANDRQH